MMKKNSNLILKTLKNSLLSGINFDDKILDFLEINNVFSDKSKKCKLCNKNFSGNNKAYGNSCLKNLYDKSGMSYFKEIEDKELFLYTAIAVKSNQDFINKEQVYYLCESYLSKLYIEKINNTKKLQNELNKCIENNKKPIMKLNTAYRISKIVKRNKKILDVNNINKIIDENLLKFFKTYFSINKITNPRFYEVYYYMQFILWEGVVKGGEYKKLKLSSKCLSHSLSVLNSKPKDIKFNDKDKYVIDLIKGEDGFKNKIKELIDKYYKKDKIIFNDSTPKDSEELYYSFENDDLFYSLHSVKINFDGYKKDNKWHLNIELTDTYDFTEILSNDKYKDSKRKYLTKGNVLNDFAAISSQYGVIKPYKIIIDFKWSDFDV
ncbi:MAG: hypothetical protein IKF01_01425 [Bacilli bacterium]|nr:hypothetical protein [Bacilli bacterium]